MMFEGIGRMIQVMFITLIITLPLGVWKLIEILIWAWNNVSININ